jgi:RimJ/RimL family protein N-acetyltransferase
MTDEPANGFCLWSVVERGSRLLIGHCGLQRLGQTGEIEIGWWLARDRWGQGLATEAARRVLAFAWEEVHLPRIVSIVQPANTASIGVMKRIGMQFERRARHGDFGLFDADIEILVYALANPARSDASPESTTGA